MVSMSGRDALDLVLLFLLMLGLGTTIDKKMMMACFRSPKGVSIGLFSQFVLMPPIGYGIGQAMGLDTVYAVALVIMTCCPGGSISNILCFLVQADVTLSVAMTTASSLAACAMLPANLLLYVKATGLSGDIEFEIIGIVLSAIVVIVGTLSGILVSPRLDDRAMKVVTVVSLLSGITLVVLGFLSNATSDDPVWGEPAKVIVSAALPVVIGSVAGNTLARLAGLPWPSAVAVGIETSVQNKLVALAIIGLTFSGEEKSKAYAIPLIYAFFATFARGNLAWSLCAWKLGLTYLDKNASCGELRAAYKSAQAKQKSRQEDGADIELTNTTSSQLSRSLTDSSTNEEVAQAEA